MCFAFGQKLGRRRMIMLGAATMLVGTAILTSSTTRAQLIVGRVVTGIASFFHLRPEGSRYNRVNHRETASIHLPFRFTNPKRVKGASEVHLCA